jgi:hypothetical protein
VADLGIKYFHAQVRDPRLLQPNRDNAIPHLRPNEIKVRAFTETPVVPLTSYQTINIIVRDQNHNPVVGAELEILVKSPTGRIEKFEMPKTNTSGTSTYRFRVDITTPGIVEVLVTASWDTLGDITKTSFQVWW